VVCFKRIGRGKGDTRSTNFPIFEILRSVSTGDARFSDPDLVKQAMSLGLEFSGHMGVNHRRLKVGFLWAESPEKMCLLKELIIRWTSIRDSVPGCSLSA